MVILAHRGFWTHPGEKNSAEALRRAFEAGYGVETDIRDYQGRVVVAHDPPASEPRLDVEGLMRIRDEIAPGAFLALNIKSDGLHPWLQEMKGGAALNWAVFDMSIPELIRYKQLSLPYFVRESEFEVPNEALYAASQGVWFDSFESSEMRFESLRSHLRGGKVACLVSPELHGRDPMGTWSVCKEHFSRFDNFMMCTDYPGKAAEFFGV